MPALFEGSDVTGQLRPEVAQAWNMPPALVVGGGGDNAAGAVGVGMADAGQAMLSLGTSGVYFAVSEGFLSKPESAVHSFCHALPGRWHLMSVMLSAASCLDWAAKLTGLASVPALIAAAQKLYEGLNKSRVSATFEETAKVMRLVVEEALAEPTMEQLKAAGLDLTEEQADQIYLYAIKGAKVLEAFRSQPANRQPDPSGDDVQAAPQQPDGD